MTSEEKEEYIENLPECDELNKKSICDYDGEKFYNIIDVTQKKLFQYVAKIEYKFINIEYNIDIL